MEGGGAEFPIPNIIHALEKDDFHFHVIALFPRDMLAAKRLEEHNICYTVLLKSRRNFLINIYQICRDLAKELKKNRPDLLWTSLPTATFYGQIFGKLLKIPVVSWQHSAYVRPYKKLLFYFMRNLTKLWVADSENVAVYLHERFRIPYKKILNWPIFSVSSTQPQSHYKPGEQPFKVGCLGRLHKLKRFNCLIQAAHILKQKDPTLEQKILFYIAGNGPEENNLKALTQTLGLKNVIFTGFLSNPEPYLASLNLYIQPSDYEGFCVAAHEAMSAGLPILSTPVGQLQISVKPGITGEYISASNPRDIADKIYFLYQNPDLLIGMGNNAKAYVQKNFSHDAFLEAARKFTKITSQFL
nr:glycosyltransferase [Entomobacter blattae]